MSLTENETEGRVAGAVDGQASEPLVDKVLTCSDCGKSFVFSAEEQAQFKSYNLHNEPKRCKVCRSKRKAMMRAQVAAGGLEQGVVCAICGSKVQLHFVPVKGRPVYCRTCYKKLARDPG